MNIDFYGSGCRCLLRLRENQGNAMISDRSFIMSHLAAYPDWAEQPGAANLGRLIDLGVELGVCAHGKVISDYNQLLSNHQEGHAILLRTEHTSQSSGTDEKYIQYSLLLDMDENQLNRWEPSRDGLADTIKASREDFWDRSAATGIVLYPAEAAAGAL